MWLAPARTLASILSPITLQNKTHDACFPAGLAMGRAQQVGRYLDPNGPQQITWVHNHSLVRGWKVILNVYDILPKRANSKHVQ